jgi:hypothetical protein
MEHSPLFERRDDLDPADLAGKPGPEKKYTAEALLALLPDDGGLTSKDWLAAAEKLLGFKEQSFKNRRAELSKKGLVYQSKLEGGEVWVKTAKGVEESRKSSHEDEVTAGDIAEVDEVLDSLEKDPFED